MTHVAVAPVIFALAAALFFAVGFVVQQHAASEEPASERLSFSLLLHLVRRPVWLLGIAAMIVGQVLGATALNDGSLALVDPITSANLVFALPLAAVWRRRHLGRREWLGAAVLVGGMAMFIAAGDPHGGAAAKLPWPNWVVACGGVALVAGLLVTVGKRYNFTDVTREATLLAAGAGVLYGLQDALTQRTLTGLHHGLGQLLTTWPVFLLIAVAVVALLLGQSAFEAAPLAASLPAITAAEPITGIAFGVGVYGEHLNLSGGMLAAELCGIVMLVSGVFLLATSPLVCSEPLAADACQRAA